MNEENSIEETCPGYTIYGYIGATPFSHLIDMDGKVVHEWPVGGQPIKMLPGGSLLGRKQLRMGKHPLKKDPDPAAVESDEPSPLRPPWMDSIELVQVNWNGEEEWSFTNWDDDGTGVMMSRQHHDIQREGNPVGFYAPGQNFIEKGKTLILSHKNRTVPEISDKELLDDVIYEVDWEGNFTGYEWHCVDHTDEIGFDTSARDALNRAPNFDDEKGFLDWVHLNSISLLGQNQWYKNGEDERFNPENIITSSRNANFIAIISRATGEFVWKLGPDFNAGTPEHHLGQFVGQHHAHMIPKGLPGEGNILVFDNGGASGYGGDVGYPRYERGYSRILEINPVSLELVWQYGAESGKEFFLSHFISGMQRLPNGNTLITDGANGRLFEVTTGKEIVWEYACPSIGAMENKVYRAYRVPPEWVPGNPCDYGSWTALLE